MLGKCSTVGQGLSSIVITVLFGLVLLLTQVPVASAALPIAAAMGSKPAKPVISRFVIGPAVGEQVLSRGNALATVSVIGATTCTLSSSKSKPIDGLPASFPCEGTGAQAPWELVMPANSGKKAEKYRLTIVATGPGGTVKASALITVSPAHQRAAVTQIAAGADNTCAEFANDHVECWGWDGLGELGNGTTEYSFPLPVEVRGLSNATQISVGASHSCAILSSGHLACWGQNEHGALGDGNTEAYSDVTAEVVGVTSAAQVSAGSLHTCALLETSGLVCWGMNNYGQLGDETLTDTDVPVSVAGLGSGVAQVSAGGYHTCALLLVGGGVKCWGYNFQGQLGNGTNIDSLVPVGVEGVASATQIAAGGYHTCALLSTGHVECWGDGYWGQLGNGIAYNGSAEGSNLPVEVAGIADATAIASGNVFSCALLSTGHVECWGGSEYGQLGDGSDSDDEGHPGIPTEVQGIEGATAVAASSASYSACALLSTGTVKCWGDDVQGQLGNGLDTTGFGGEIQGYIFSTPVDVQGLP
jgi:alpha-tubulin suppressor-like RCC1 family protein